MSIEVEREGRNLGPLRHERRYDFNHQSIEPADLETLLPGDALYMNCHYDTSKTSDEVEFGDLTQQEMCYAIILYYPLQKGDEDDGFGF